MFKLYKLFFISFLLLFLWLKPVYSFFIVFAFVFEYFCLFNYLYTIYRKYDEYCSICITEVDVSDMNFYDIWLEYCRILAFKKIYFFLIKKKKNFTSILYFGLIIFLEIPVKFLRLFYFFMISKDSFNNAIIDLYFTEFWKVKYLKIEVLNKKIYLNCFTPGKFAKALLSHNCMVTEKNYMGCISDLKKETIRFNHFDQEKVRVELFMAKSKDKFLFRSHYGYIEKNNSIHATSNAPSICLENQSIDVPIASLVKSTAIKPASVITTDIDEFIKFGIFKMIPKSELSAIMFNNRKIFTIDDVWYEIIDTKEQSFTTILKRYNIIDKRNDLLVKEMIANNYKTTLLYASNESFIEGYKFFYLNRNNNDI